MSAGLATAPAVPGAEVSRWSRTATAAAAVGGLGVVGLAAVPMVFLPVVANKLTTLLALVILAVTWNALAGYSGLVSVGQQGFFGIGAYAVLVASDLGVNAFVAVPLAGVAAGVLALGTSFLAFRLRGGQFAIGMWVIAEVLRLLVSRVGSLGAGTGRSLTSVIGIDPAIRQALTYWTALGMTVLVCGGMFLLLRSRVGLRLQAVRDDERAAAAVGVEVTAQKRIVFALASGGAGIAGAVTLTNTLTAQPDDLFGVQWSALMIFMVVIGGLGTFEGPVLGAVVLFAVQQAFDQYGTWYVVGLGAFAVLVTLLAPRGIWGELVHRTGWAVAPVGYTVRSPLPATSAGSPS